VIEILSGRKSGQAIVTLAVGHNYEASWKINAFPALEEYCTKHNIGLYIQNESLDAAPVKKKIQWQKLLLPIELQKNFQFIKDFCYIDTDVIVNVNAPSVFSYNDNRIALVSQFKNLPFELSLVLRRIAFYRHHLYSKDYPLDSSLFMTIKQIYDYHDLIPQQDYACTGFIMGSISEHSEKFREIYLKYDANVKSLTEGGEEPLLNYELQNQFDINWLPYKFQALWLYEMASHYPFLYEELVDSEMIVNCVQTSIDNNFFLHFAGGWHESEMISKLNKLNYKFQKNTEFYEYMNTPVTGKSVGRVLPKR
jgi:hypothetical protein